MSRRAIAARLNNSPPRRCNQTPRARLPTEYSNRKEFPWVVMQSVSKIWSRLEKLGFTGLATRLYIPVGRDIDSCFFECRYGSLILEVAITSDKFEVYCNAPEYVDYSGSLCIIYFDEKGAIHKSLIINGDIRVDISSLLFGEKGFFNK